MPRGGSVRGFTPAGRKPRHRITGHLQVSEPSLEDLCKLPGLRLELASGDVVTVNEQGVPCGHDGSPAIVTDGRRRRADQD